MQLHTWRRSRGVEVSWPSLLNVGVKAIYSPLFTRKLVAMIEKQKRQTHGKKLNTRTWCKEFTKCYKLARYLQRNVRASWLAVRMTFGLYLPNMSCIRYLRLPNNLWPVVSGNVDLDCTELIWCWCYCPALRNTFSYLKRTKMQDFVQRFKKNLWRCYRRMPESLLNYTWLQLRHKSTSQELYECHKSTCVTDKINIATRAHATDCCKFVKFIMRPVRQCITAIRKVPVHW